MSVETGFRMALAGRRKSVERLTFPGFVEYQKFSARVLVCIYIEINLA